MKRYVLRVYDDERLIKKIRNKEEIRKELYDEIVIKVDKELLRAVAILFIGGFILLKIIEAVVS